MSTDLNLNQIDPKKVLKNCWGEGVASVRGEHAVNQALFEYGPQRIDRLLAVGKAASSMCQGAIDFISSNAQCLVITKYGHTDQQIVEDQRFQIMESAHPVPDLNSMKAGILAMNYVESILPSQTFLMLVSGGASSLLEVLSEGLGLEFLKTLTDAMLANGLDINQINSVRTRISLIKGGKLLALCKSKSAHVLLISDVPHDDTAVIGSGIGCTSPSQLIESEIPVEIEELLADAGMGMRKNQLIPAVSNFSSKVIASNSIARNICEQFANKRGLPVVMNEELLHGAIDEVVNRISKIILSGPSGVYIFGGEPTVVLPENPGRGGRMQHFALSVAKSIRGRSDIHLIAAGTDGTDGPTNAAGGMVDGSTYERDSGADAALVAADAGRYLERVGGLFLSGPTGTNVMDIVIVLKS
ncbi:MAG: DUF4147 domain-containing protein [Gammaproteobacteria bacterium]|nr:DUF4147 domain-containing protein [Gammaproteobacteria bacterium]MCY4274332.1 DUF4147 domain-containing protein [Gammaproteobacteria bacterium]